MTANTPPKPHTEGMEWTNTETGIKYMFTNGGWRAVSSEASEEVADAISKLDLQTVLDNGNVADKGAEFGGKVKVQPGTEDNEVVTYEQLLELEEEIEQLAPSSERGSWNFKMTCSNLDGEFCMTTVETQAQYDQKKEVLDAELSQCLLNAAQDPIASSECTRNYETKLNALTPPGTVYNTDDFSLVTKLSFSGFDANQVNHSFQDVEIGQIIDLLDENGAYMVGEVTSLPSGLWYENHDLGVKVIKFKGTADGRCRIKIFSLSEELDPQELDNFVRNTGDTMTGKLSVKPETGAASLAVYAGPDATDNSYVSYVYGKTITNQDGSTSRPMVFSVNGKGDISASTAYSPSKNAHLTTKSFVEYVVAEVRRDLSYAMDPARYSWKVGSNVKTAPPKGHIHLSGTDFANSEEIRINLIDWREKVNLYNFEADGNHTIYNSSREDDATPFTIHGWIKSGATDNKWKYKGYAGIRFIRAYGSGESQYLKLILTNLRWAYGSISGGRYYNFSIQGLF